MLAKLEVSDMTLYYLASKQEKAAHPDAWLLGIPKKGFIKEIAIWRSPAYVELFDLVSHGRHVHRKLVFTSDMVWSFHSPSGPELPMYSSPNAGPNSAVLGSLWGALGSFSTFFPLLST